MTTTETRIDPADWPGAIADTDGYQMIVAGPGTGKTEFLVRRVAHLLESGVARHDEIAVLCFSRRAASALRSRVKDASGSTAAQVDVSTFHSLALRLDEERSQGKAPSPLTTPEQVALVSKVLAREDLADWPITYRGIISTPAFAAEVADFVMRCSERLLTPDEVSSMAAKRADWRGLPGLYRRYLAALDAGQRTDYAVLIATAVRSLASDAGEEISSRYRYVLVDEYQDSTPAQAEFARLLARAHGNLTVTGDPYQSIYSFRGAELRNVADFMERHPTAHRVVLTESFRVPEQIMTAALRVVAGGELPGAAGPVRPAPHPGRTEAYIFNQETAEAEWIAEQVEHSIVVEGVEPARIAVLVRSKRELLPELSRALARRAVPHDPPASRVVDHPAVAMVRNLVTVALAGGSLRTANAIEANSADRAMRQLLLGPVYDLGLGRERSLLRSRRRTWEPWHRVVTERAPEFPGLAALLGDRSWATDIPAAEGFWHVWSVLDGLEAVVEAEDRADWRQAWAAFAQALSRQAERDPGLDLASYFAMTDEDDFEAEPMLGLRLPEQRVALTTLHQAKGLEFDIVFIANASEGVFPDLRRSRRMLRPELLSPERTTDPEAQHRFQVQEEMRLAYTAMTRARSRVVWTATSAGVDQGEKRPSRFLLAAADSSLGELGPPTPVERDPVTLVEAQTMLRRRLLDPFVPAPQRLAAATVLASRPGGHWDPMRFAGVSSPGPDRPVLPERFSLSPSQAGSYRACPRKYVLERRLKLGSSDNQYTMYGTLVHEVLETSEREILGAGVRHNDLDRALEIVDQVWETADFGTPALNQAQHSKARKDITHLYSNWPGKGDPVALEHEVTFLIGGVSWYGKIDRVERREEGVALVDYKTSRNAMRAEDAASDLQLAFYAMAWDGPEPVVAASFWYPGVATKSVSTREYPLHRLADAKVEMEELTRSIGEEDWSPRVSNDCERCPFISSCPAWPEGRGAFLP